MKNRQKSLWMLLGMYLLAVSVGTAIYMLLAGVIANPVWLMLVADVVMTLVIWGFGLLVRNASTYDPYWSVIPPLMLLGWIIFLKIPFTLPVALMALALIFWSVRLTYNWFINWQDLSYQDWRYTMIRSKNPKLWFLANLFGINLMPTLIVFIQMIGSYRFLTIGSGLNIVILIGFLLAILAAAIQFVSDRQMLNFRYRNKENKKCIDEGLWRLSRHPNYFGEVLMWWAVWTMYAGASGRIDFQIVAPILMTALFLFISIPMMEKKILLTRPEYRDYMRQVSALFPFFRRHADSVPESDSQS